MYNLTDFFLKILSSFHFVDLALLWVFETFNHAEIKIRYNNLKPGFENFKRLRRIETKIITNYVNYKVP